MQTFGGLDHMETHRGHIFMDYNNEFEKWESSSINKSFKKSYRNRNWLIAVLSVILLQVIVDVLLPMFSSDVVVRTYKIMPRAQVLHLPSHKSICG